MFSPHKNLIPYKVFILSFLLASTTYAQEGNVPDAVEYQALVDLYNATDGPNWTDNTNWLNGTTNTDFDTWYGVTVENGDVVDIEFLNGNNLIGTLPSSIGDLTELNMLWLGSGTGTVPLTGNIPSSISQLANLHTLDIAISSPYIDEINQLGNLTYLSLNGITSEISSGISNLTNLTFLSIQESEITYIPIEVGQLVNLVTLNISFNTQLDSQIPSELGNITPLANLLLLENDLTGTIPSELGNITGLQAIWLGGNRLSGAIPTSLSNIPALELFRVEGNNLYSAPDFNSGNHNIQFLDLGQNAVDFGTLEPNFTGPGTHPFPTFTYSPQAEIGEEQNLAFALGAPFDIPFTTGGTRNFYQWQKKDAQDAWQDISGATTSDFSKATFEATDIGEYRVVVTNEWVTDLTLYSKSIFVYQTDCGVVPDALEYLALVDLYNATNGANWTNNTNWLQGNTCTDFANWYGVTVENGDVTVIQLTSNNLDGTLPLSIFNLTELRTFDIVNNSVFGSIPSEFAQLDKLVELVLANNEFSGPIPEQLWSLTSLQILRLNNNQLIGDLSPLVGNLSDLRTLKLEHNSITGELPPEINSLLSLREITVGNNLLSGELGSKLSALSGLRSIHIEANSFSGEFPDYLVNIFNAQATVQMILNDNSIDHFPDFSSNQNANQTDIRLANNRLDFGDIEPNFSGVNTHPYAFFTYSPQAEIGEGQNLAYALGAPFDIPFTTGGARNFYQWQKKDAQDVWQDIHGATSSSFIKASFEASDVGEYRVVVTNEWVTDLTLYSKVFTVIDVSDCPGGVVTIAPMILPGDGSGNGTITLQVSSNASPYTYSWSGGLPGQKNHIGTVAAGTYSVIVTGSDGCSTPLSNLIVGDLSCQELSANATVDGQSITINTTGGAAPYTYYLSPFYVSKNTNQDIRPPGIYDAYVTDANGCSTFIDNIVVPGAPGCVNYATLTGNIYCNNPDSAKFILYVNDEVGPIDYLLLPHGSSLPSPQFSGTASVGLNEIEVTGVELDDFYYAVVTDRGCAGGTFSNLVRLEFYPDPELSVVTQIDDGTGNGTIDLTVTGGMAPYTFSWSGGLAAQEDHIGTVPAGAYSVTVTDLNGCSSLLEDIVVTSSSTCFLSNEYSFESTDETCSEGGTIAVDFISDVSAFDFQLFDLFGPTDVSDQVVFNRESATRVIYSDIPPSDYLVRVSNPITGCYQTIDGFGITILPAPGSGNNAGSDQSICTQTTTMAASGATGQWTQESGPSQAIFAAPTSPTSQVTLGKPGLYTFRWTTTDAGCSPGTDEVTIIYEPNFSVNIEPSDGRKVQQLSRGRFYNPDGTVDSGVNYPTEGGGIYNGLAIDNERNTVYVGSRLTGIWTLNRNTNEGFLIETTTELPGDNYNQFDPWDMFLDEDSDMLYVAGWPKGTNAGALWKYDLVNGSGTAFYPGWLPAGGGDPFPNGIGNGVDKLDDMVFVSLGDFGGSFPESGLYVYDEAQQTGKFLTAENTVLGGSYEVIGDPMPGNYCLNSKTVDRKGKRYLYVSILNHGIWEYNITDNTGRILSPESTASSGMHPVLGDPLHTTESYNISIHGGLLLCNSWEAGIWLYDLNSNKGKVLTVESASPGGKNEVIGDPLPTNYGAGLDYDAVTGTLYAGMSGMTLPTRFGSGFDDAGVWKYNLRTNEAKRLIAGDIGFEMLEYSTFPVAYDRRSNELYAIPTVDLPNSGLTIFDFRQGTYICNGETIELKARVTGSSVVTYQWYESGSLIAGATNSTYSTPSPGFYTVSVTEGSCSYLSEPFIVGEAGFDNLTISPEGPVALCEGSSTLLSVPSGYAGYQWYKDGAPVASANLNSIEVSELNAGSYTVEATTSEGCTGTSLNSVSVAPGNFNVTYTKSFDHEIGFGSIDLTITGGTAPYNFSWSDELDPLEDQILNLPIGFYDVTVTDANGCTKSFNNIGIGFDQCSFSIATSVTRDDGSGNGAIDITVTGGTAPYTFAWSGGLPAQEDQTGLINGIYRVMVSDATGCEESRFINLSDNCPDILSYQILSSDVRCAGANNGIIAVIVTEGVPPYEFELFDIETGNEVPALPILKPLVNNVGIFGGLEPSEYVVGIRQPECDFLSVFESRGIIIREPEELAATYISTGDNGTGTGTIDISVSGGTTPYTYLWSDGGSTLEDRTGLAAGAYSVQVTDARFCTFELDDIFVEDANNCSRSHPMRFLMGLESATEFVCNDGTSSGEITVNLGFVNTPPFSGVSYTFRLVENDGSFDPHTNSGGTLIQEFANVIPTTNLFSYTFSNVPPTVHSYVATVTANGITPPQDPNCLFGSYGFVKDIIIKPAPVPGSSFTTNHSLLRIGEVIGVTAGQFVNGYIYRYDWNDGNATTTKRSTAKHRFDAAGDFDINLTVTTDLGCVSQSTQSIRVFDYICESPVPQNGGQFYVDDITGKIAFRKEDCPGNFLLSCVSATAQPDVLDNAVSASSVTYSDEWYFNDRQLASIDQPEGSNEFETGQLGKWRVKNSYAYKSELFETGQNLSNGTFTLEDFTWRYEDANNPKKWIRSSSIEQYSANGEAIQERNVLDIPSTAKFGYHGALPYLTAQNAEYE
ncbi:MAG: PKD domain-containing protein, partial [Bacteroidota bacterium]